MLPPTVQLAFAPASSLEDAQRQARQLATGHYENFPVVSRLVPKALRQDFCNIYIFCRVADDLSDEVGDKALSLQYLADFRRQTEEMYAVGSALADGIVPVPGDIPSAKADPTRSATVVFTALSETVRKHDIPAQPFLDLIDAFEQDQRIARYETFDQVVDYCRRSADPVGRLILYVSGYRDDLRQRLSDRTCTALQLANFWQDVHRDLIDRDRIYLPRESMVRFGVTEDQIRSGRCDENFRSLLKFEVDRCQAIFDEGKALLPLLKPSVRRHVALFGKGGEAILQAIRNQNYDTLSRRPKLSKWQKGRLICSAMVSMLLESFAGVFARKEPA